MVSKGRNLHKRRRRAKGYTAEGFSGEALVKSASAGVRGFAVQSQTICVSLNQPYLLRRGFLRDARQD